MESIVLGGGCFWCTEAIFKRINGVLKAESGYANSNQIDPSYDDVASGQTGAAESNKVTFDPNIISLEKILDVFFRLHDPTTLNRQGNDVGTEYRSAIFYENEDQKEIALKVLKKITDEKLYPDPLVTEVAPLKNFYEAEADHKDFYDRNKDAPYCRLVIDPKIQKLYKLSTEEDIKLKK